VDVLLADIAQIHQHIGHVLEVGPGTVLGGIDPFDDLRVSPARNPCLHTRRVVSGPGDLVVVQLNIIYPAIDHGDDQLLQIEPEIVPIVGLLAHEIRRVGLVQSGVQLRASISGN